MSMQTGLLSLKKNACLLAYMSLLIVNAGLGNSYFPSTLLLDAREPRPFSWNARRRKEINIVSLNMECSAQIAEVDRSKQRSCIPLNDDYFNDPEMPVINFIRPFHIISLISFRWWLANRHMLSIFDYNLHEDLNSHLPFYDLCFLYLSFNKPLYVDINTNTDMNIHAW